jgi:hypothetical protein
MDTTPEEAYHEVSRSPLPERRGVSRRSVIEEAKAKVPTIDLADPDACERAIKSLLKSPIKTAAEPAPEPDGRNDAPIRNEKEVSDVEQTPDRPSEIAYPEPL